jgi:NADH-quinone oxidoreductase subunit J
MLLNLQVEQRSSVPAPLVGFAALGSVALGGLVLAAVRAAPLGTPMPVHAGFGGTESLAERLFTVYLLPFELTSLLLLVAIVGAVVVGRKRGAS